MQKPFQVLFGAVFALLLVACTHQGSREGQPMSTLERKIQSFEPAVIEVDLDLLPGSERSALIELILASRVIDEIFLEQAWASNLGLREKLRTESSTEGKRRLRLFEIMKGPWDRQDHFRPFAVSTERPPGANFYPEDMTKDEFLAACGESDEARTILSSPVTLVRRSNRKLHAVPYHEAFSKNLERAARHLENAARLTREESLRRFLLSRAAAFRSSDYRESEMLWMDLDSRLEITIGPYETYEDELLGLKAAFESFVTVIDPKASEDLARWKERLPAWEASLPIPEHYKTVRGRESPIRVADLVFSAGDARKSVQTIAFNLPNDEVVRAEKGAKKVLLRNMIRTKFDLILMPIAKRILVPDQIPFLSSDAFFHHVLFHELSHSLGPAFVTHDGRQEEVRIVLGADHSALEEAKADVMGAFHLLNEIRAGSFPTSFRDQVIVSYVLGLFRSVRFGIAEAHGKGAALQINTFLRDGAAAIDTEDGRLRVHPETVEASIHALLSEILMIQAEGQAAAAAQILADRGVVFPAWRSLIDDMRDVPVDLRPIYPAAGESTEG